jgi:hypothetical protein
MVTVEAKMRRFLIAFLLVAALGQAQSIKYTPAGSGGSFTTPGAGIIVDTDGSGTLAGREIAAGTGVLVSNGDGAAGNPTISIDSAVVPQFTSGTGAVPGTGTLGSFYFETDIPAAYGYPSANTEHWFLSIAPGSIAQGDIFYASGANQLARLGAGTSGHFLKTNGAAANPEWAAVSGSSSPDATVISLEDDFVSGLTTSGTIGALGWTGAAASSGTFAQAGGVAERPGIVRLASHASNDNSGYTIRLLMQPVVLNSMTDWDYRLDFLPGSDSTAITNIALVAGFSESSAFNPAGTVNHCLWIRYDTDLSDAVYKFVVGDASGATGCGSAGDDTGVRVADSTIAPVAGTWNKLKIYQRASGVGGLKTIYFQVDSETPVSFCSSGCTETLANLDTTDTTGYAGVMYFTRTTTGVLSGDVDYFSFQGTGLAR